MTPALVAVDTSVVVAAFATWQEGHEPAHRALLSGPRLPAHCAIESYSVLTRLPAPYRVDGRLASDYLSRWFPDPPLALSGDAQVGLIARLVDIGVTGGACYDALVAITALDARATLLTRDRRAVAVYERVGATYELL